MTAASKTGVPVSEQIWKTWTAKGGGFVRRWLPKNMKYGSWKVKATLWRVINGTNRTQ